MDSSLVQFAKTNIVKQLNYPFTTLCSCVRIYTKERHVIYSHIPYREMLSLAGDMGFLDFSGPRILRLKDDEKRDFIRRAKNIAGASEYEISKFLRISEDEVINLQFGRNVDN